METYIPIPSGPYRDRKQTTNVKRINPQNRPGQGLPLLYLLTIAYLMSPLDTAAGFMPAVRWSDDFARFLTNIVVMVMTARKHLRWITGLLLSIVILCVFIFVVCSLNLISYLFWLIRL